MTYDHQKKIIQDNPLKCGLFLGTGSGKSRTALLLATGRTLVVCPKTVRDAKTWEIEKEKLGLTIDLTVVSKEQFKAFFKTGFETVIFDEAHTIAGVTPSVKYKNRVAYPKTSQIFECATLFLRANNPKRVYLLTATPVRSPMVVWGLARLIGVNWDFYKFRDAFYVKINIGREVYVQRKGIAVKEKLGKLVRRLGYTGQLTDYFDVPEQTFRKILLDMTVQQRARIEELSVEYPDPIVFFGKCHQVENGALAPNEFAQAEFIVDRKTDAILDLALEFPRMIIFAKYIQQIEKIRNALTKEGYITNVMTGATNNREEIIKWAETAPYGILIVQSGISSGWEVPSIPVMVFASLDWSIVNYVQALGRIQRANNLKKNLYISLVVKGGVDEDVYKAVVDDKMDFHLAIYAEKRS